MKETIRAYIKLLKLDRKKRQRLISLICALSFLVAGGVFWNLRIIGITLSRGALPDPNADVETRTEWEATLPNPAVMTGQWGADLVSVAYSQLGYKESKNNFIVDKTTGEKKGWTRYGAWDENSYADWSSLFVSFCINYAGIPLDAVPESPFAERDPNTLLSALNASEFYKSPDYIPVPGDLIFLDKNGDGVADAMGIITAWHGIPGEPEAPAPDEIRGSEAITAELLIPQERSAAPESGEVSDPLPGEPVFEAPAFPGAVCDIREFDLPVDLPSARGRSASEPPVGGTVYAIEGDSLNSVSETDYDFLDPAILGYMSMGAVYTDYTGLEPYRSGGDFSALSGSVTGEYKTGVDSITVKLNTNAVTDQNVVVKITTTNGGTLPSTTQITLRSSQTSYTFSGLSRTGIYKITYTPIPGYTVSSASYPTGYLTGAGNSVATYTWEPANKFLNGRTYAFTFTSGGYDKSLAAPESNKAEGSDLDADSATIGTDNKPTPTGIDDWSEWRVVAVNTDGNLACLYNPHTGWYIIYDDVNDRFVVTKVVQTGDISLPRLIYMDQYNGSDAALTGNNFHLYNLVNGTSGLGYNVIMYYNSTQDAYIGSEYFDQCTIFSCFVKVESLPDESAAEVIFTVKQDTTLPASEQKLAHNKQIDWLGDEGNNPDTAVRGLSDYRLYLDVTSETEAIDLLVIVDNSGSMFNDGKDHEYNNKIYTGGTPDINVQSDYKTYTGESPTLIDNSYYISRMQAVMDFLNDYADGTQEGFMTSFLESNPYNRLAVISFASNLSPGADWGYEVNSKINQDWISGSVPAMVFPFEPGATDYTAGLYRAEDMFGEVAGNGHKKLMLFLSDGEPTVSCENKTIIQNTYTGGFYSDIIGQQTMTAIDYFAAKCPDVAASAVAFHGVGDEFDNQFLGAIASNMHGVFHEAVTADQLTHSINELVFPANASITDTLSGWVDFHSTKDLLVTVSHEDGTALVELYKNDAVLSAGQGILHPNTPVVIEGKTVTLNFAPGYQLPAGDKFTISFNVMLNLDAKNHYLNHGNSYPDEGDPNTDYPGNRTSVYRPGFFTNADNAAALRYTLAGENFSEAYYRPVAQYKTDASSGGESGTYEMSKTIDFLGEKGDDGNFVNNNPDTTLLGDEFYRIYLNWSGALDKAYDLVLVIDTSASMLETLTGLSPSDYGYSAADSREALVEKVLNGDGNDPGLIKKFLDGNPNNRISMITFNGIPPDELDYTWTPVDSIANEGVYRLYNSTYGALAMDENRTWTWLGLDETNPEEQFWACPNDEVQAGYLALVNTGYGIMPGTESSSDPNVLRALGFKLDGDGHLCTDTVPVQYMGNQQSSGFSGTTNEPVLVNNVSDALKFTTTKRSTGFDYSVDAHTDRDWGRDDSAVDLNVVTNRGTNYSAGLLKAKELLDASYSPNKMMIFISDGAPTYWMFDNVVRGGTGFSKQLCLQRAEDYAIDWAESMQDEYPDVLMRSLMVNNADVDMDAIDAINSEMIDDPENPGQRIHKHALHATNAAQLETFLNQLLFPYGVKIEDTLSQYVDMHDLASVKVTRTDTSGETPTTPVTIWNGASPGAETAQNNDQIASVTYDTVSKKLTVQFAETFIADPRYTYTASLPMMKPPSPQPKTALKPLKLSRSPLCRFPINPAMSIINGLTSWASFKIPRILMMKLPTRM